MAYIRANYDKNGKTRSYTAEIFLGYDENGKPIRKYVTRKLKADCKKAAQEIELNYKEKTTSNIGKKKVVTWFEEYIEIHWHEFSPGTVSLYLSYLRNHIAPFFKNMKMEDVTDYHLGKFQSKLLENLERSSVRRIMGALQGAFTEGLKDKTPFKGFSIIEPNDPDVRAPSPEELMAILDALTGHVVYQLLAMLAAWCGLRRGEALALRENDLDFAEKTIRVDETWIKDKNGNFVLKAPKSKYGKRIVRAPDELMDALYKYIIKQRKVVELRPQGDRFLFNLRVDSFSTSFRRYLRRRGAPDYSFHELRHYHATWMFLNGVPDPYAAQRMGHTIEVLRQNYQHLGLREKQELDEKIANNITKPAQII